MNVCKFGGDIIKGVKDHKFDSERHRDVIKKIISKLDEQRIKSEDFNFEDEADKFMEEIF